jgi:hypothetical protein
MVAAAAVKPVRGELKQLKKCSDSKRFIECSHVSGALNFCQGASSVIASWYVIGTRSVAI